MPLFAAFFASCFSSLVAFFSAFFLQQTAVKLAAYSAWIVVLGAFLVSVAICLTTINGFITGAIGGIGDGWLSYFWMGLGMFIPANASVVITCQGSVWVATTLYKVQKESIRHFAA